MNHTDLINENCKSKKYTRNTLPYFWAKARTHCNCGSFALNLTSWFVPYDGDPLDATEDREDYISNCLQEGQEVEEIYEDLLEKDWNCILDECPWLEPIELKDAKITDRVIAYRLFIDTDDDYLEDQDFHFRVRINGFWFEKCGSGSIHFCGVKAEEEPWECGGGLIYDSEIRYARFKN